ncbi:hypothetical protein J6590_022348 [Homalodisca vitripennis]|nr:hypothetical protein J6590_022348 [Homalodisca vitripennis]
MLPSAWGTRRVPRSSRCASIPAKRTTATPHNVDVLPNRQRQEDTVPTLLNSSQTHKRTSTQKKKETTTIIFRPPHLVFKGICGPGGTPWFSPRLPLGAGKLTDTFLLLAFTFYWCLRASNKSNPISTYMRHKSSLANSYVPNE